MTNFSYIAIDKLGKIQRGTAQEANFSQLEKNLELQGLEVVSFTGKKEETTSLLNLNPLFFIKQLLFRKITDLEKINFSHHLALMLKAGVPILEAVEILETETSSPRFKKLITILLNELEKGKTLSSVLIKEKFFLVSHLAIIKSGETSGQIVEALNRISRDLKRDYQIKKKVKGAMSYPIIICLTLIGISGFIVMFVLPKVGEVFRQMNLPLPLPTKILLGAGYLLNHYFIIIMLFLLTAIIAFLAILNFTSFGLLLTIKIIYRLPVIKGIIYQMNMARFIRSLSSLMLGGVPIAESLISAGEVFSASRYQMIITEISEKVKNGVSLTSAFKQYQNSFGGLLVKMLSVGERSGKLAEILEDMASFYEGEVESKLDNFTTIIEPLLMLMVGIGVGAMILAIIGPIYQMIGQMTT